MKKLALAAILLLAATLKSQAKTDTIVIGVPPSMSEAVVVDVKKALQQTLFHAKAGDRVCLIDARNGLVIANITKSAGRPRAVQKKMEPELRKVRAFLNLAASNRARTDVDEIRLPEFLATVGSLVRTGGSATRALVIGSPRYKAAKGFSFTQGEVPNDRFITCSSARSVYGASDRRDSLKGIAVHFLYVAKFENVLERRALARFIQCYCSDLGAQLGSFKPEVEIVLERLQNRVTDPAVLGAKIDRSVKDFVIIRYGGEEKKVTPAPSPEPKKMALAEPLPTAEAQSSPSISPKVLKAVNAAAKNIEARRRGNVVIGAWWWTSSTRAAAVDVDVYFRKNGKSQELYFGNKETEGGWHRGDVMRSHSVGDDADWKVAGEVIEVEDTDLGEASLWLNLFKGTGERVDGIVRIINPKGQVVDVPFVFNGKGDRAKGKLSREKSASWLRIDLTKEVSHVASK